MKLDFEYGHGHDVREFAGRYGCVHPGKTIPDPGMPASGLGQPVRGYSGFPAGIPWDGAAAGAGDSR